MTGSESGRAVRFCLFSHPQMRQHPAGAMENIFFDLKRLKYLGVGAIIGKTVRIRKPEECVIGDHTILDDFTYISCPLEIGRFSHIASNVTISGGHGRVTIGDFVGVATGCSLHAASSDYLEGSLDYPSIPAEFQFGGQCEDIVFEDFVLLGAKSVVLPGVHLPEGVSTGALSVISKRKYRPWTLYVRGQREMKRDGAELKRRAADLLAHHARHSRASDETPLST
jgi:acetyltransferase-like isoleucine patch superfamily enzyme